jgi:hypothetical protein
LTQAAAESKVKTDKQHHSAATGQRGRNQRMAEGGQMQLPAPFEYAKATSVEQLLADNGEEARVIAEPGRYLG